ncbi:DegT/DnrJ/EryC1/StrS family aminotransferase [Candidatus Fermentibacterales bacterium]|nr:DegT/DnrJ/EryC1/StrS family aminotransferase [Candidatus Fermentibacterales bacterium]
MSVRRFRVDLRSDTVTVPSHGMRQAMSHALVGDDVFREDPTVRELEARVAEMLGKESGLFMVSGTMSNGIALRVLGKPGDEIICGRHSHIYCYEGGAAAFMGGMQLHTLSENEHGLIEEDELMAALGRHEDIHFAPRTVLALENTHNIRGGRILPPAAAARILSIGASAGLRAYLDGARLWNAAVSLECGVGELTGAYDMVSVCFSKGMGCPIGSVLAGSGEDMDRARWFRKRYGGGMRQVGIIAAACIYALEHNISRLAKTHEYARKLARAANSSPILSADPSSVDTNIVLVTTPESTAPSVVRALEEQGIGCFATGPSTIRLVTHLSLGERDVKYAADTLAMFGA